MYPDSVDVGKPVLVGDVPACAKTSFHERPSSVETWTRAVSVDVAMASRLRNVIAASLPAR